eukprot:6480280-Amphidinium_carterae.1
MWFAQTSCLFSVVAPHFFSIKLSSLSSWVSPPYNSLSVLAARPFVAVAVSGVAACPAYRVAAVALAVVAAAPFPDGQDAVRTLAVAGVCLRLVAERHSHDHPEAVIAQRPSTNGQHDTAAKL